MEVSKEGDLFSNFILKKYSLHIKFYLFLFLQMSLQHWVNDELHSLLGFSDAQLASFIISTARSSSSADDLLRKLNAVDDTIQINVKTRAFAVQLLDKLPQPGKSFYV